jgi:hypothetical protein
MLGQEESGKKKQVLYHSPRPEGKSLTCGGIGE